MIKPRFCNLVFCLPFISSSQKSINNQPYVTYRTFLCVGQPPGEGNLQRLCLALLWGTISPFIQWTLEQHRFELCKSIYTPVFSDSRYHGTIRCGSWRRHRYRGPGAGAVSASLPPTLCKVQLELNSVHSGRFHPSADLTFQLPPNFLLLKTLFIWHSKTGRIFTFLPLRTSFLPSLNNSKSVYPKLSS